MKEKSQRYEKDLEAAANQGVVIYQDGKAVSVKDIADTVWVREEMAYIPDFIVVDEKGQLKEIWYQMMSAIFV